MKIVALYPMPGQLRHFLVRTEGRTLVVDFDQVRSCVQVRPLGGAVLSAHDMDLALNDVVLSLCARLVRDRPSSPGCVS